MTRAILAALAVTTAFTASPLMAQPAAENGQAFEEAFEQWSHIIRAQKTLPEPPPPPQPQPHRPVQAPEPSRPVRSHPSQGYDPCNSSHPDYGGADYAACMMKRGELTFDRELWGIAKLSREARRQLREFGY